MSQFSYEKAGVSIERANRFTEIIKPLAKKQLDLKFWAALAALARFLRFNHTRSQFWCLAPMASAQS